MRLGCVTHCCLFVHLHNPRCHPLFQPACTIFPPSGHTFRNSSRVNAVVGELKSRKELREEFWDWKEVEIRSLIVDFWCTLTVFIYAEDKRMIHAVDRRVLVSGGTHFHSEVMHELVPKARAHTHTRTRSHTLIHTESELAGPVWLNVNRNIGSLFSVCTCFMVWWKCNWCYLIKKVFCSQSWWKQGVDSWENFDSEEAAFGGEPVLICWCVICDIKRQNVPQVCAFQSVKNALEEE